MRYARSFVHGDMSSRLWTMQNAGMHCVLPYILQLNVQWAEEICNPKLAFWCSLCVGAGPWTTFVVN